MLVLHLFYFTVNLGLGSAPVRMLLTTCHSMLLPQEGSLLNVLTVSLWELTLPVE